MASKWREVFQKASLETRPPGEDGKKKGKAVIAVQRPAALPRSAKATSEPAAATGKRAGGKDASAAKVTPVARSAKTDGGTKSGGAAKGAPATPRPESSGKTESAARVSGGKAESASRSDGDAPGKAAGRPEVVVRAEAVVVTEAASTPQTQAGPDPAARRKKGTAKKPAGAAEVDAGARAEAFTARVKQVLNRPPRQAAARSAAARAATGETRTSRPVPANPTSMVTVVADSATLDKEAPRRAVPAVPAASARAPAVISRGPAAPARTQPPATPAGLSPPAAPASGQALGGVELPAAPGATGIALGTQAPVTGEPGVEAGPPAVAPDAAAINREPPGHGGDRKTSRLALIKAAAARAERPPSSPARNTPRPEIVAEAPGAGSPVGEDPAARPLPPAAEVMVAVPPAAAPVVEVVASAAQAVGRSEIVVPAPESIPVAEVARESETAVAPVSISPAPEALAPAAEVFTSGSSAAENPATESIAPATDVAPVAAVVAAPPSEAITLPAELTPPAEAPVAQEAASPAVTPAAGAVTPATAEDRVESGTRARGTSSIASAAKAWLAEIRAEAANRVSTPVAGVQEARAALDAAAPAEALVTAALEEPSTDGNPVGEDASPWALDWQAPSSGEIESMLSGVVEETAVDRARPLESPWVTASSSAAELEAVALPAGIEGLEPAGAQALSAVDVAVSPPLQVQTAPPVEVESLLREVATVEPRGPEPFAAGAVAAVAAVTAPDLSAAARFSPPALPDEVVQPPAAAASKAAARTAGRGRIELEAIPPAWQEATTEIELTDGEGGVNDLVLAVMPDAPPPAQAKAPSPRRSRSPVTWLFSKLRGLVARR